MNTEGDFWGNRLTWFDRTRMRIWCMFTYWRMKTWKPAPPEQKGMP